MYTQGRAVASHNVNAQISEQQPLQQEVEVQRVLINTLMLNQDFQLAWEIMMQHKCVKEDALKYNFLLERLLHGCRSGYVGDCKSSYLGSNPSLCSSKHDLKCFLRAVLIFKERFVSLIT